MVLLAVVLLVADMVLVAVVLLQAVLLRRSTHGATCTSEGPVELVEVCRDGRNHLTPPIVSAAKETTLQL